MPKTTLKETPETVSMLDCSTGHITKRDASLLGRNNCPRPVYAYPEGWFVHVLTPKDEPEGLQELRDFGFSPEFMTLFTICAEQGHGFLRLDCDGTVYHDLPYNDWNDKKGRRICPTR